MPVVLWLFHKESSSFRWFKPAHEQRVIHTALSAFKSSFLLPSQLFCLFCHFNFEFILFYFILSLRVVGSFPCCRQCCLTDLLSACHFFHYWKWHFIYIPYFICVCLSVFLSVCLSLDNLLKQFFLIEKVYRGQYFNSVHKNDFIFTDSMQVLMQKPKNNHTSCFLYILDLIY